MKTLTEQEWNAEGERIFGTIDRKFWQFYCPSCKTIQSWHDFVKASVTPDKISKYLGFSCIGRFTKNKGCNWTLGGLFSIHTLEVSDQPMFEFYEKEKYDKIIADEKTAKDKRHQDKLDLAAKMDKATVNPDFSMNVTCPNCEHVWDLLAEDDDNIYITVLKRWLTNEDMEFLKEGGYKENCPDCDHEFIIDKIER